MEVLLVTSPIDFAGEQDLIEQMFDKSPFSLHIRKPGQSENKLEKFLLSLPREILDLAVLHGYPEMAHSFGLLGSALPAHRLDSIVEGVQPYALCSQMEEIALLPPSSKALLYPVLNSLSEPGVSGKFENFLLGKKEFEKKDFEKNLGDETKKIIEGDQSGKESGVNDQNVETEKSSAKFLESSRSDEEFLTARESFSPSNELKRSNFSGAFQMENSGESLESSQSGEKFLDSHEDFARVLKETRANVFAFGGISEEEFPLISKRGFYGAAVCGAVWNYADPLSAWIRILRAAKKF